MDFINNLGTNNVSTATSSPLESILVTFFPAYKLIIDRLPGLHFLGIFLAIYYFIPFGSLTEWWKNASSIVVSSVEVTTDEDLFEFLIKFLTSKRTFRLSYILNAMTNKPVKDRFDRTDDDNKNTIKPKKNSVWFEEGPGKQFFMYKGKLIWVERIETEGSRWFRGGSRNREKVTFSVLGRSTLILQEMFEQIYSLAREAEMTQTIVRRPVTAEYGRGMQWARLAAKKRRMLDTVVLRGAQKEELVKDVQEYMKKETEQFYAERGIPHRRGYLFYGPPGCGKTSFCLALASKFDLDVFILTLLDHELDDTTLIALFNELPSPCLLLLEDIDEAGLGRTSAQNKKASNDITGDDDDDDDDNNNNRNDDSTRNRTRVTLSGLLNAIDGVAAPEGHILIMTTNKPEDLDEALVRAGRISVRTEFSKATKLQAKELFLRMYGRSHRFRIRDVSNPAPLPAYSDSVDEKSPLTTTVENVPKVTDEEEDEGEDPAVLFHAEAFTEQLNEDDFSPAELQDYLLTYKNDPAGAVSGVKTWVESVHAERKKLADKIEAEKAERAQKKKEKKERWAKDVKDAVTGGWDDEQQKTTEDVQKKTSEDVQKKTTEDVAEDMVKVEHEQGHGEKTSAEVTNEKK